MVVGGARVRFRIPGLHAAVFAAVMWLLSSCSSGSAFQRPPKLHSLQEAASVNVTALSVAPWEDYVDTLQMQFPLAPADALTLALPQTSISQQSFAEALGLGLQVAPPPEHTVANNNYQQ
jgi:hypothetical protein